METANPSRRKSSLFKHTGFTHIRTTAATATFRAIQEILLQTITDSRPELWASAADGASLAVARVGIVALRITAHDRFALLVTTRTLSGCALQSAAAAVLPVGRGNVGRTCARGPCTDLLRIAYAGAGAADGAVRRELAIPTAILIGVVTHRSAREFAGGGIAAVIVTTTFHPATVTLFARLHDAIAAFLARDGVDLCIVRETGRLDAIATDRAADVAHRAHTKVCDTLHSGRIHDILLAGVARAGTQWTALL